MAPKVVQNFIGPQFFIVISKDIWLTEKKKKEKKKQGSGMG